MTTETERLKLLELLDKAAQMASQYSGGYSVEFASAEEFHKALSDSIVHLKAGDNTQLDILYIWFLPTSCWDDFVGMEGLELGNEISELLIEMTK